MKRGSKSKLLECNLKGQFISAPPPSSLTTPALSSLPNTQPLTLVHHFSSLASVSHISSPSDLPGSYLTSLLASPALGSSIDTHSHPALPTISPDLTFPTLPISQLSQPALHPSNFAALLAPPSIPVPASTTVLPPSLTQCSTAIPSTLTSSTSQPAQSIAQSPTSTTSIAPTPTQKALPPAPSPQPAAISPVVPSSQLCTSTLPHTSSSQLTLPAAPSSMTSTASRTGIMPTPQSKNVPYFSGKHDESLTDFFYKFDNLANNHRLTGAQKTEAVLCYVPVGTQKFWKTLDGYIQDDWTALCMKLEKLYQDIADSNCYTRADLQDFARISARTCIWDKDDLILYYRHFHQIASPLSIATQITDKEQNINFFNSFHLEDCNIIYNRLFTIDPTHPCNHMPSLEDTYEAAFGCFVNDQFYLHTAYDTFNDDTPSIEHCLMEQWFGNDLPNLKHFEQDHIPQYNQQDHDTLHRSTTQDPLWVPLNQHSKYTTKSVCFQDPKLVLDVKNLSLCNLILAMHSFNICDANYAVLYAQCI